MPTNGSSGSRDAEVRLRPSRGWSAAPLCPFVEMLLWTASDCSKGSVCQKIRTFCQVGTAEQPRDGPRFSIGARWFQPRPRLSVCSTFRKKHFFENHQKGLSGKKVKREVEQKSQAG